MRRRLIQVAPPGGGGQIILHAQPAVAWQRYRLRRHIGDGNNSHAQRTHQGFQNIHRQIVRGTGWLAVGAMDHAIVDDQQGRTWLGYIGLQQFDPMPPGCTPSGMRPLLRLQDEAAPLSAVEVRTTEQVIHQRLC
ncbi:TPA: hypothetical protein QDZ88_001189 [Stenotrophomonas maltophilia]|nr:hypothetical protein [Stenotrophomonas maltophilia]HDS1160309.1 hypothetical protein [Stenotrophomonas maltophilia]